MSIPVTGHTRLCCLLGSPVAHSISPLMHNESFRERDIDCVYLCFDVGKDSLGEVVRALRDCSVLGFNLTMPLKEAVLPFLDDLSEEAALIGAVNTVKNENGRLVGYNTDGMGYIRSVQAEGCEISGREMTLMGAGGAAAAIAVQAALSGASALHLAARAGKSWNRAVALTEQINASTSCRADLTDLSDTDTLQEVIDRSVLLTNATSAGMSPHEDVTPLPETVTLSPGLFVSDIIYNPRQTKFLKKAASQGCRYSNGLYMLLYQGAVAFKIWTGQEMPLELVRKKVFLSE